MTDMEAAEVIAAMEAADMMADMGEAAVTERVMADMGEAAVTEGVMVLAMEAAVTEGVEVAIATKGDRWVSMAAAEMTGTGIAGGSVAAVMEAEIRWEDLVIT